MVYALRRIEADAEGALQHGGALRKALEAIRDQAGAIAAEAAKESGMAPYGSSNKA
jgi:hypothetical protein